MAPLEPFPVFPEGILKILVQIKSIFKKGVKLRQVFLQILPTRLETIGHKIASSAQLWQSYHVSNGYIPFREKIQ